jgi:hypothetical protein
MHQREIHREHDPIGEGADGAVFQMSDGSVVKIGDVHREHPLPDVYHEMAQREIEIAKSRVKQV